MLTYKILHKLEILQAFRQEGGIREVKYEPTCIVLPCFVNFVAVFIDKFQTLFEVSIT